MAKRTKQEKIIADLRRRLRVQEVSKREKWEVRGEKQEVEVRSKKVETEKAYAPFRPQVSIFTVPTSYIKKDLLRTLILTIVAISLEVVVYLVWH